MDTATDSILSKTENMENLTLYTENNTALEEESSEWEEVARIIYIIGKPTLVIVGTIGNLLAFFVMRRGSMKKVSTCFYMSILALADAGVLWSGAFVGFVGHLTHWEVDLDIYTDCKPGYFLYYFCLHYSSSLLAIMSIEKFFALYFPLRTKSICTVRTAKWVTAITALLLAAFDAQFFFVYDVRPHEDGYDYCKFVGVSENYQLTFNRIDSIIYSFGPFVIMTLANSAIIYKFMKAKLDSRKEGTESTNQALNKSAYKGTAMLITVSVTFILLTGPISVTYALTDSPNDLFHAIIIILQYLNHSINGILYCIVGSRFRNELKNALTCKKEGLTTRRSTYVHSVSTNVNYGKYANSDSKVLPETGSHM